MGLPVYHIIYHQLRVPLGKQSTWDGCVGLPEAQPSVIRDPDVNKLLEKIVDPNFLD